MKEFDHTGVMQKGKTEHFVGRQFYVYSYKLTEVLVVCFVLRKVYLRPAGKVFLNLSGKRITIVLIRLVRIIISFHTLQSTDLF